jgi:alpha-glucosidase (family GH31 glycosyl hydrolase)
MGKTQLEVTACTHRIVRVRLVRGEAQDRPSYVGARTWPATPIASPDRDSTSLSTDQCRIALSPTARQLEFGNGTEVFLRTTEEGGLWCNGDSDGRSGARFEIQGEQHFYGLGHGGQQFDRLGGARELWNSMVGHGPGSNVPMPLLVSNRGYAIFFDNTSDGSLVVGRLDGAQQITYSVQGGPLDIYFLAGSDLRGTMAEVAHLLGRAPMPPRWSLGFIQSTRHYESTEELRELPSKLRKRRIPCDALMMLSSYADANGWNLGVGHLAWQTALWNDPKALIDEMHGQHFRVITHEYPVVHPEAPQFSDATEKGFILSEGYPTLDLPRPHSNYRQGQKYIDFSNEEAGKWWWGEHKPLVELGIDGWWLDGGEGPPSTSRMHGGDGSYLHNIYDRMRQQAFFEGQARDRPETRPFLLCRSGASGMQRFGAVSLSGDIINTFATLANQIPVALNTGMSGVPYWGSDIGGLYQAIPPTGELFARWFQFGAFCPVFRSHGWIWREHLPWSHGPEVESICRAYAELRYRLFPYTYTLAWHARQKGLPLMRPLVLNYPDDPRVWELGDQYLWGDDILVAPVTREGARSWSVYLPSGAWYDFWTQRRYEGMRGVEVAAPVDRLPLFVREGAIVPMGPVVQYSDEAPLTEVTVLIYPGASSEFTLYEDDGLSNKYHAGAYAETTITCTKVEGTCSISVSPASGDGSLIPDGRVYIIKMYAGRPNAVLSDGDKPLPEITASDRHPGWWHDGEHFLFIRMPAVAGSARVHS